MRHYLIGWVFIILIFSSCESQNEFETINLFISPDSQYAVKNSGEIINFNISIISSSDMSELLVIETINNSSVDTLLDIAINGTDVQQPFFYTVPDIIAEDTSEVQLLFYCKDINGKSVQRAKIFYAISSAVPLVGTSGHTMYSSAATLNLNSYDLLNGIATDCHLGISHINDDWPPSSGTTLSRRWTSVDADLDFVKANSFDYANATNITLQQQWELSVPKQKFVDNIQNDDIIITLIDNTYVVIKLTSVIDDVGVENDKYIFSIKK